MPYTGTLKSLKERLESIDSEELLLSLSSSTLLDETSCTVSAFDDTITDSTVLENTLVQK